MRGDELLDKMELLDPKLVDAADAAPKKKHSKVKMWTAVAACLCIVIAAAVLLSQNGKIRLSDASTATASYGFDGEDDRSDWKIQYEWYDEDELFSGDDLYAFRGTVTELYDITLDYNGKLMGESIATVKIEKVYKGDLKVGDEITVELPYPVCSGASIKGPNIIRSIKVGMEGIFMPRAWDENTYSEYNGAVIMHRDLAECGFADGFRGFFLDTEYGLTYWKDAYPGAKGAETLDDIEEYVINMLK